MILSTRAIVFRAINYSETSVIAKVFTEELGLRSYMIKGVRTSKNKNKQNLLQPLSLIEMEVYENPKKDIQQIKSLKPAHVLNSIPFDFVKMSVVFFLNEVLQKSVRETDQNKSLFHFIYSSILELDADAECSSRFHLNFMLRLAYFLGIEPLNNYSAHYPYFDLKEGCFQPKQIDPFLSLDEESSRLLHHILKNNEELELNRSQRNYIQDIFLKYYEIHLEGFGNIHSHMVLRDVLR
ncbi:DNA repair protein RecO [Bacteroidales bacterium OttesenSCG-928-C19]|nr:DNA repair protein RecO [Bacteroidales bacterium OttesenSCG-928-C19]